MGREHGELSEAVVAVWNSAALVIAPHSVQSWTPLPFSASARVAWFVLSLPQKQPALSANFVHCKCRLPLLQNDYLRDEARTLNNYFDSLYHAWNEWFTVFLCPAGRNILDRREDASMIACGSILTMLAIWKRPVIKPHTACALAVNPCLVD